MEQTGVYLNTRSEWPKLNHQEFKIGSFVRPLHLGMMGELACLPCLGNGKLVSVQFYLILQVEYSKTYLVLHCHVR